MLEATGSMRDGEMKFECEQMQAIIRETGLEPSGYVPDTGDDELNEQLKLVKVASTYDVDNKNFHIVPLRVEKQCSEKSKKAVGKYDECCKKLLEWLEGNGRHSPLGSGHGTGTRFCHWYNYFQPDGSVYQYLIGCNTLTRNGKTKTVSNNLGKIQFMQFLARPGQVNYGRKPEIKFMYPPTSDDWCHSLEIVDKNTGRKARHFILNTSFRVADGGCPDRIVDAFEQFIALCEESPLDVSGDYLADRLKEYVLHSCGKSD